MGHIFLFYPTPPHPIPWQFMPVPSHLIPRNSHYNIKMEYSSFKIIKFMKVTKIKQDIDYAVIACRRRRLKDIHSRSDTNRTGAEGLSFYYPRLLYCLNQMLAVMSLSQHRVSSSKTVRPRAPCGARCTI